MGLDTAIRKFIRDIAVPSAWSISAKTHKGQVVIEDLLIRMMDLAHRTYPQSGPITGAELFSFVWDAVSTELMKPEFRAYVLVVDDKQHVKSKNLKSRVHKERTKARDDAVVAKNRKYAEAADKQSKETGQVVEAKKDVSNVPYKEGFTLIDEGLVWYPPFPNELCHFDGPGDTCVCGSNCDLKLSDHHDAKEQQVPIRFELSRLMATDRIAIWEYFRNKLRQQHIPPGKLVIFDYHVNGPVFFGHSDAPHQHLDMAHDHGESDLSILYWMRQFRRHPLRIVSTDTDIIALILCYLFQTAQSDWNPVLEWQYKNQEFKPLERFGETKAPFYVVDMLCVYRKWPEAMNMTIPQLLVACILSHTDHYDKHLISSGFGFEPIFEAVRLLRDDLPNVLLVHECDREEGLPQIHHQVTEVLKRFRVCLATIDQRRINKSKPPPAGKWVTYAANYTDDELRRAVIDFDWDRDRLQLALPSDASFKQAASEVLDNVNYWYESWTHFTPSRRATMKQYFHTTPSSSSSSSKLSGLPFCFVPKRKPETDNTRSSSSSSSSSTGKRVARASSSAVSVPTYRFPSAKVAAVRVDDDKPDTGAK